MTKTQRNTRTNRILNAAITFIALFLLLVATSCFRTPEKKWAKLIEKHPELLLRDTIRIKDSAYTRIDTVKLKESVKEYIETIIEIESPCDTLGRLTPAFKDKAKQTLERKLADACEGIVLNNPIRFTGSDYTALVYAKNGQVFCIVDVKPANCPDCNKICGKLPWYIKALIGLLLGVIILVLIIKRM
jgi:hypothetical protein